VIYFADAGRSFLTTPPDWTISDRSVIWPDGEPGRIEQRPFHWVNGVWEAEVMIHRRDALRASHRALVRVVPDTLRRWKEIGIDPHVEACAQLRDHLRRVRDGEVSLLTLL
jgi:hypothetical protein